MGAVVPTSDIRPMVACIGAGPIIVVAPTIVAGFIEVGSTAVACIEAACIGVALTVAEYTAGEGYIAAERLPARPRRRRMPGGGASLWPSRGPSEARFEDMDFYLGPPRERGEGDHIARSWGQLARCGVPVVPRRTSVPLGARVSVSSAMPTRCR